MAYHFQEKKSLVFDIKGEIFKQRHLLCISQLNMI